MCYLMTCMICYGFEIVKQKVREYQSTSNLIARLQAKYNYIEKAFTENSNGNLGGQTFKLVLTEVVHENDEIYIADLLLLLVEAIELIDLLS